MTLTLIRPSECAPDIEQQLTPIAPDYLKWIILRLMMHFRCPPGVKQHRLLAEYMEKLGGFPEDLLCAAYHHTLRRHTSPALPGIGELIAFMEPEMLRRQQRQAGAEA